MYERIEKLYKHKIFQMEKVLPSFQYEPLVLTRGLETSNEEEKGQSDGVGQLETKTTKEEPIDLRGGGDITQREVDGLKYV